MILVVAGCADRAALPGQDIALPDSHFPLRIESGVDILFVVDNSDSVEQYQVALSRNFPTLVEALRSTRLGGQGCSAAALQNCRIPDLHLGVVSTDLGAGPYSIGWCQVSGGDGGRLQNAPKKAGCRPPRDSWISYQGGVTNVDEPGVDPVQRIKDAFSCIAELGSGACTLEHQLEAARRALDPAIGVNPGFLRFGALLVVVWLTDEDDCSARRTELFDPSRQAMTDPLGPLTSFRCFEFGLECDQRGREPGPRTNCHPGGGWLYPIEEYAQFFQTLKPAGHVLLFAIAGPTQKAEVIMEGNNPQLTASCQSAMGQAAPAFRVEALVRSFGQRGHFNEGLTEDGQPVEVSVCATDYSPALRLIGRTIAAALQ